MKRGGGGLLMQPWMEMKNKEMDVIGENALERVFGVEFIGKGADVDMKR